ncbi:uncharacterized protein [Clytia hemisphaerica]|uniref:uncharacterized protein n=1 Tax=Clytia hemisphaerica TaxID=252671 RepID=UPI0034D5D1DB
MKIVLPQRIATLVSSLKSTTSRLQRIAASIAFIDQALFVNVIPTFARVKGNFLNDKDQKKAEIGILKTHRENHKKTLKYLSNEQYRLKKKLYWLTGDILGNILISRVLNLLRFDNRKQLKSKFEKIRWLRWKQGQSSKKDNFQVPIINLSGQDLNHECLRYGLNHCFIDKNKFVKKDLAIELEHLAEQTDEFIDDNKREEYHEYLRKLTNNLSKNVYQSKDDTFKLTRELRENENIVILSGDKDTSITILTKSDYQEKVQKMIDEGIKDGKYKSVDDTVYKDLSSFQGFLLRHFQKHPDYKKMYPSNNQPARFFASAKTHKFKDINDVNLVDLKLRPIIDQTGTCYYQAGKIIGEYLKPIADNEFVIKDTQTFPHLLKELPALKHDEEEVSYDVESLFTSVPIKDTIDFICTEIYTENKLKPICKESIFRKLLLKLTTECIFTANEKLYKQTDGVSMGGPLSVVFTGCFMNQMEQLIVKPSKPLFYRRYVDDTYVRRKKGQIDTLYDSLNNHHKNIKFTIEENPKTFLDTSISRLPNGTAKFKVVNKETKLPFHWSSKVPLQYKRSVIKGELSRAYRIATSFKDELVRIRSKYSNAGYPEKFVESQIRSFRNSKEETENIIPTWLFKEEIVTEKKSKVFFKIPYCPKNESMMKNCHCKFTKVH